MTRELEDAEHAKHPERDERAAEVLVVGDAESDVVREDRDDVDDAHHRPDVFTAQRRGVESQQILTGEQHHARRVQTEQFDLVALAARQVAVGARMMAARHRLGDVGEDGQRDEEPGNVVEDQGRCARLWVLERPPHVFTRRRRDVLIALYIVHALKYIILHHTLAP